MLTSLGVYLSHHLQAAVGSLKSLLRKPMATSLTIVVIAITLALPALFWVFTYNVEQLTVDWKQGGHISLYLKPSLSTQDQTSLLIEVKQIKGVGDASLRSPNDGLVQLQKQEGMEDIMNYLPDNPLPPLIEVIPAFNIDSASEIEQLYRKLRAMPGVEQAKVDIQWVNRLHAILTFASDVVHGLMALLALAVVLVIGNTLRLAIQNRSEEIQVLKLIGATDGFIVRPFLYSGIWYGLFGALVAILLVNLFLLSLVVAANQLAEAYSMQYPFHGLPLQQTLLLLVSAAILGWLGARLSVKRQLAAIEPCY
jgi:cell division transport system permease protein